MNKINYLLLILFFASCKSEVKDKVNSKPYFDSATYFEREIKRLSLSNPTVVKEVSVNGKKETKTLKITDWKTELSTFSAADNNKAAWRGEFKVDTVDASVVYKSINAKVAVKQLTITRNRGQVKSIVVIKGTKNYLYQSTDTLTYYPDSLYSVKTTQKVKLLSPKNYAITGTIKN